MGVSTGHEMGLLLGELTASDAVVSADDTLGELGVLERPEAQETRLEKPVVGAVDVVLTIANDDEVWVLHVDVDTGDHTTVSVRALEREQMVERDLVFLDLFIVLLLLFLLLFFRLSATQGHQTTLLLLVVLVLIIVELLFKIHRRVVLVSNVLVMELSLREESLNDLDCWQDSVWQLHLQVLDLLLDFAKVAHLGAHLVGTSLTHGGTAHHVTGL